MVRSTGSTDKVVRDVLFYDAGTQHRVIPHRRYVGNRELESYVTCPAINENWWYKCELLMSFSRLLRHARVNLPVVIVNDLYDIQGLQWPHSNTGNPTGM